MMYYKLNQFLLVLSTLIIVSACGGGGGGGGRSDDGGLVGGSDPGAMQAQVGGNAVKGIVIKGNVTAIELDSAGNNLRVVGTATTDSDGGYNLTLDSSYQGGPIEIVVSNGPETTMVCDVVPDCGDRTDGLTDSNDPLVNNFGEEYKPANLFMTAMLGDAQNGETIAIQVTPYTHMAARRAKSAPLTSASIDSANSEVSVLLGGIDILRTSPVDITNPASLQNANAFDIIYSGLAAAIAKQALPDPNNQPDLNQALDHLSRSYALNGEFDSIALQLILDNTISVLKAVGVTDTSGILDSIRAAVINAEGGSIDPQPNPNVGDSDVQKTRLFLSDLRTWGTVIFQELESPMQAFDTQVELVQTAADAILNDDIALEAISAGVDVIVETGLSGMQCDRGNAIAFDDSPCTDFIDYDTNHGFFTGTVTRSTSNGSSTYTISNASVNVAGKVATLDLVVNVPANEALLSTVAVAIESATADSEFDRMVVSNGSVTLTSPNPVLINYFDQREYEDARITMTVLALDVVITQKKILVNGIPQVATNPINYAGKLDVTAFNYIDPVNGEGTDDFIPGSVALGGAVSNNLGDSVSFDFTLSIPTAAADVVNPARLLPVGSTYADNNGGSHLSAWTKSVDEFTYSNPEEYYS